MTVRGKFVKISNKFFTLPREVANNWENETLKNHVKETIILDDTNIN